VSGRSLQRGSFGPLPLKKGKGGIVKKGMHAKEKKTNFRREKKDGRLN